jgi:hypothetical protein
MTDLSPTTWDHAFFLQARSALSATIALESSVSDTCQQLHCLQMSIECLGKAYISRGSGTAPARRHDAFSLRAAEIPLAVLSKEDSELTQRLLRSFRAVQHFAIEIEGLNPALAQRGSGINVEYPWIFVDEVLSPVTFNFSKTFPRAKRLRLINVLDNLLIFEGY